MPVKSGLKATKAFVCVTVASIACCCINIHLCKMVLLIIRDLLLVVGLMIVMSGSNFANFMGKIASLCRECIF